MNELSGRQQRPEQVDNFFEAGSRAIDGIAADTVNLGATMVRGSLQTANAVAQRMFHGLGRLAGTRFDLGSSATTERGDQP